MEGDPQYHQLPPSHACQELILEPVGDPQTLGSYQVQLLLCPPMLVPMVTSGGWSGSLGVAGLWLPRPGGI